jgi:hypothetical protein
MGVLTNEAFVIGSGFAGFDAQKTFGLGIKQPCRRWVRKLP